MATQTGGEKKKAVRNDINYEKTIKKYTNENRNRPNDKVNYSNASRNAFLDS